MLSHSTGMTTFSFSFVYSFVYSCRAWIAQGKILATPAAWVQWKARVTVACPRWWFLGQKTLESQHHHLWECICKLVIKVKHWDNTFFHTLTFAKSLGSWTRGHRLNIQICSKRLGKCLLNKTNVSSLFLHSCAIPSKNVMENAHRMDFIWIWLPRTARGFWEYSKLGGGVEYLSLNSYLYYWSSDRRIIS